MKKIFVSALVFDDGKSGISNYIENTLYQLAKENQLFVAILKKDSYQFTRKHKNINFICFPDFVESPILNLFVHMFILPFFINNKYDFTFLPAANRRLMLFYPTFTIATFHDLSQYNIEKKYDLLRTFYIKNIIPILLKPINKIIAVSHNTKNDLVKFFDIDPKRIIVNYNGYDKDLYQKVNIKEKQIKKNYFLYVSRIEHPGKNHLNLVKAYERLPNTIKKKYDLLLVGNKKEKADIVTDYIDSSINKSNIHILGFVDNDDLPSIFANATLFIFPSYYEGFGIPLVEAMAMDVPILSASNSSLLEIGEGVCEFFDENSPVDMALKIQKVLNDDILQKEMIRQGQQKINQFDWSSHAKKIIKIYNEQ